jgi:hypothetical protein
MPYYDPAMEALIAACLESLDHDADMTHGYTDQLRQLDVTIRHILADAESHEPTPEQEQQMRQALGVLDAKAGDASLDYLDVLRRLQAAVEKELFRWDSSLVQPVGFSGESQIPIGGGEWETHQPGLSDAAVLRREAAPRG